MTTLTKQVDMQDNVVQFKRNKREGVTVYEMVQIVLSDLAESSKNTAKNYEGNYKEFFKKILNKEIEFVEWGELIDISYSDVMQYRDSLKKVNINKTINTKIASLKTLYKHLRRENKKIDIQVVNLDKLPEREEDSSQYGSLTGEEVDGLIDYCRLLPYNQKPQEKTMFFKLAFATAIRVKAILGLKWKDIRYLKDADGSRVRVIEVRDKGKLVQTPISDKLYDELVSMRDETNETFLELEVGSQDYEDRQNSRVINVSDKTLRKTLKDFCELRGIEEERNIVLHSLKKASLDKVYSSTKNINITARHGHHEGVEMVYKHYEGKNDSYKDMPSYNMFDGEEKVDVSKLEGLSKEELLAAIMKSSDSVIEEVLSKVE